MHSQLPLESSAASGPGPRRPGGPVRDLVVSLLLVWVVGVFGFCLCEASTMNGYLPMPTKVGIGSMDWDKVFASVILWASYAALCVTLLRRLTSGLGLALGLLGVVSAGNYLKVHAIGQVVVPADLYMLSEPELLVHYLPGGWPAACGLALLAVGVVGLIVRERKRRAPLHWTAASVLAGQGLVGVILTLAIANIVPSWRRALGSDIFAIQVAIWRPVATAECDGLLLSFLTDVRSAVLERPAGKSLADSLAYVARLGQPATPGGGSGVALAAKAPVTPVAVEAAADPVGPPAPPLAGPRRVVVVMLESWIDPNWYDVQLDRDPAPNFHALQKQSYNFRLVSPMVGGGTANIEFEALTGLSMAAFPKDSYPYLHFLRKPVISIPSVLTRAGFDAAAVHNFNPTMWHRNLVYPLIGFARFDNEDNLNPRLVRRYLDLPRDEHLYDMVADELTAHPQAGGHFVFAISMTSHGPFDGGQLPDGAKIVHVVGTAGGKPMITPVRRGLEVYFNKQLQADRALGRFVTRLEHDFPDVTLVAYGDHQPGLSSYIPDRVDLKRELAGFATMRPELEAETLYITPGIIRLPPGAPPPRLAARMLSPNCLSPSLLDLAGVAKPRYFETIAELCKEHPIFHRQRAADDPGAGVDPDYQNLAYDVIFNSDALIRVR